MLHLHLETKYQILRYGQNKQPVKADYPSFNERPNAQQNEKEKKTCTIQCRAIVREVMNLRIT
jgi:hypothetical protein